MIEKLNNSAVNDHFDVTRRYLKDIIQKILGIKDDSVIKYNKPLSELGIDSLLGLEIKKSIDSAIGIKLPATLVFNYPTIDKISEFLLSDVLNEKVSSESMNNLEKEISEDESDKMIDNINELSDAEAEKLLLDKLNSNEFDDLVENE